VLKIPREEVLPPARNLVTFAEQPLLQPGNAAGIFPVELAVRLQRALIRGVILTTRGSPLSSASFSRHDFRVFAGQENETNQRKKRSPKGNPFFVRAPLR